MLIELLTDRAGAGWVQHAGEVHDLPHAEAARLIAAGCAVASVRKVESAIVAPFERANINRKPIPRNQNHASRSS